MALLLILLLLMDAELSLFQNHLVTNLVVFVSSFIFTLNTLFCTIFNFASINLSILQMFGEHFLLNLVLCLSDCLILNGCDSETLIRILFSEIKFF